MALMSSGKQSGPGGGPGPASDTHQYWAFLSYSHQDGAHADWLHKAIEHFTLPKGLAGRVTATGAVPSKLSPIFRDRSELAASNDLGQTIRAALKRSRFLIVLCSPAAAKSRWVNEEILTFKKLNGERRVLAAIVDGEPWASEIPGREAEECFPAALRERIDRKGQATGKRSEPIAADLRTDRDGREAGKLKLIAGMLGLGLDDLVKREQQRRQKRLTYIAAASIAGMTVASGLAVFAFEKRDEARDQRREAEGLVGFMLGDLRDKLEPIGRLDALDAVGSRALKYFENQDKSELSDAALTQRSKALTLMGEIASTRGDLDGALRRYREAWAGTAEALRRKPDDPQRIFDHAQNVFWVGTIDLQRGRLDAAERAMREYKRLASALVASDPSKKEWQLESIYADSNLGIILIDLGRYKEATLAFRSALDRREAMVSGEPGNATYRKTFGEGLAWLSEALEKDGRIDDALAQRERQIAFLDRLIKEPRSDADYSRSKMVALRAAGRLLAMRGDLGQGLKYLKSSVSIGDELMRTEPENAQWAAVAAASYADLGELQLNAGQIDAAGASARTACDITGRLIAKDSSVEDWRLDRQSHCLSLRTRLALARGETAEALRSSMAMEQLTRSEARKGITASKRDLLLLALLLRGLSEGSAGNRPAAQSSFSAALAAWPKGTAQTPTTTARLGLVYLGLGQTAAAASEQGKLDAMGYRHPTYLRERQMLRRI
jgi:tetratricopeptide (TPR) repeat protein